MQQNNATEINAVRNLVDDVAANAVIVITVYRCSTNCQTGISRAGIPDSHCRSSVFNA